MLPNKKDSRDDDIQLAQRQLIVLHITGPRSRFPEFCWKWHWILVVTISVSKSWSWNVFSKTNADPAMSSSQWEQTSSTGITSDRSWWSTLYACPRCLTHHTCVVIFRSSQISDNISTAGQKWRTQLQKISADRVIFTDPNKIYISVKVIFRCWRSCQPRRFL